MKVTEKDVERLKRQISVRKDILSRYPGISNEANQELVELDIQRRDLQIEKDRLHRRKAEAEDEYDRARNLRSSSQAKLERLLQHPQTEIIKKSCAKHAKDMRFHEKAVETSRKTLSYYQKAISDNARICSDVASRFRARAAQAQDERASEEKINVVQHEEPGGR
ncbi:hypothetical protein HDU67_001384 [Dinochytrium kinnereticum]|nr:hypothetical protein HDU67_001384 [Dinochytrium kinnereticum]